MEMRKITLGDCIIDCASGPFGSNLKVECFVEDGFPIIDGANLKGVRVTDNITKFVTEEKARSLSRSIAKRRDVIVTISGTLGQISFIPNDSKYNEYLCSQRQFRVTFDESKIDVEYLVNYLHTDFGQKKILSFANYVGVPALAQPLPNFKKIELLIPSIQNQKKVVQVLSALDDKIALNKKMNQKLEAMAKRLYDYWFVQYDFPDKNGHPYKTTGGPMTYNPTLKREIPVGWEVKQICDIAKIFNGSTPSTTEEGNYGGEIVWITPKDLSDQNCKFVYQGARNITQAGYDSCSTTMVPKGTVVMSSRAPIGLLSIAQCDLCTNQGFKNMVPNDMADSKYLYYTIQQHIPQIQNLGTGTTFKEVSKDELGRFAILYPPKKLITTFEEKMAPIFDVQFNKVKEISRLTALRDKLLPLLMNGQVVVG